MSNLENLTSKILAEAKGKAQEIVGTAKSEAEAKIARETAAAQVEADKLIADAKTEAELTAERIVQGKMLAIRDENLGAKRQMLDKVFAEALKKLNSMPEDEYVAYLREYLPKLDLKGQTVVVPARYTGAKKLDKATPLNGGLESFVSGIAGEKAVEKVNEIVDGIKDRLTGPAGSEKFNADIEFSDRLDGGFVLVKDGIEQNHTFSALLDYYRYELESEVLKILYA